MSAGGLIGTTVLDTEEDVVAVRQRARWLAERLGFDRHGQVRLATAVSELARSAIAHGGGGQLQYALDQAVSPHELTVRVTGRDSGFAEAGSPLDHHVPASTGPRWSLQSARRLVDSLEITGDPGGGRSVLLRKALPGGQTLSAGQFRALCAALEREQPPSPLSEMRQQHRELLTSLEELRRRQDELAQLNAELEDTNRGVVALYAEIEERADALRQANELKSRFLSHMTHEFRTPLNAILALTRILLDRSDGELTDEQERQIQYVRSAAIGLTDLVNDLLDLAKVQAGKAGVQPSPFRVVDLFGALRGMLRPLLGSDSVKLVFESADDLPILRTDEAKVSQILRNFISNALKFTEAGEVRVSAEANRADRTVVFSVRDTGIGIAPEHQARIFEEYFQVDTPLQHRIKGTGLGLALSARLAELLGGGVRVQSAPGQGSTFYLEIPQEFEETQAADDGTAADGRTRVLVIDDEETSRYIIRRLLRELPCTVSEATNGRDGLLRAQTDQPDLIVLDLRLPAMDGYEVLACLAEDPLTAGIPVVIVTSSVIAPDDRRRLERAAGIFWKDSLSRESMTTMLAQALRPGSGEDRVKRAHSDS